MIGIGSTVWVFDGNRRVYAKDANGRATGGPIWRKHWGEEIIASETSRSWVTKFGLKIPKKGARPRGIVFSEAEIDELAYVNDHAWRIGDKVRHVRDAATLRQIAALVGYEL